MARSRRRAVQAYHDRVAPRYDHSYADAYWQWHDALTWDYMKPLLPRDLSAPIVDLGCGTGKWAGKLVSSGYRVTCVDISPRMLEQARESIARRGGAARATFLQADLDDLSAVPAGQFELAIALGDPLGCVASPVRALRQVGRILRPGGLLVATFDNRLAALDYYLTRDDPSGLTRFLRDGKTHWLTKVKEEQFPITTFSPGDVLRLMESAGFTVLELLGKTVLPMRHFRQLLATPQARRSWARIEKALCRDPFALGRASHLQVTCRRAPD